VKKIATPAHWLAFAPDSKSLLTAAHANRPLKDDVVTRWDLATYEGRPYSQVSEEGARSRRGASVSPRPPARS
jgi:hypothetical protein